MQKNNTSMSAEEKRRSRRVYAIFITHMVIGMGLALFTPEDILTYPWAKAWAEGVLKNTFPKLLDVPSLSQIPQVVPFYHATMLIVCCLCVIWAICVLASNHWERCQHPPEAYLIEQAKSRMTSIVISAVSVLFLIGLFHAFYVDGYGVDENDISIGKYAGLLFFSRSSLVIGALLLPWSTALFLLVGNINVVLQFAYLYPYLPWFSKKKSKK